MNPPRTSLRYNSIPQQSRYQYLRPVYRPGNHGGGAHRDRSRRRYPSLGLGGYPYIYGRSWELLPWDLAYPGLPEDENSNDNTEFQPMDQEQQSPSGDSERYRPEYTAAPYRPQPDEAAASAQAPTRPELELIFKDGHTQNIRNYVLTTSDVIVMDDAVSGRIPRIQLAELDLPATERAAQQKGLDFSPPSR